MGIELLGDGPEVLKMWETIVIHAVAFLMIFGIVWWLLEQFYGQGE